MLFDSKEDPFFPENLPSEPCGPSSAIDGRRENGIRELYDLTLLLDDIQRDLDAQVMLKMLNIPMQQIQHAWNLVNRDSKPIPRFEKLFSDKAFTTM
ncbi:MAG: hypothetical protein ACXABD_05950 [Candidatus Thorarchaeota archaeon]